MEPLSSLAGRDMEKEKAIYVDAALRRCKDGEGA
jgi:hypothetical protein